MILINTISVRLGNRDTRLIKEYKKAKNITISALVLDLQLYHDSMAAHRKQSGAISFDDMMKELDLE